MRPASAAGTHKESVLTCGDNHKRDRATHALPDEDKVAAANPVGLDRVVDGGGHVSKPAIPSLFSFSPSPSRPHVLLGVDVIVAPGSLGVVFQHVRAD